MVYGLKVDYFVINPKKEYQIFFAREEEFGQFLKDLEATINSGRVPRSVVFGLFGVGKTQFLLHLKYALSSKATCVYIESPSCHRRTRFVEFYRSIVMALGRQTVINSLAKGMELVQQSKKELSEIGLSEELASIISNALANNKQFTLWRWLVGQKLSSADATSLEAVRQELADEDAVAILNAMAILNLHFSQKPLLLLIDEFENTRDISGDARISFTEAMRSLVDEGSQIGAVFTLTARALAEMPGPISDEPVKRRIGITNYVRFEEYNESELEKFIKQVILYRREEHFNVSKELSSIRSTETVTEDTYPFSQEAIEEIVKSVVLFKEQEKIEAVRPKEALEIMDKALRIAIEEKLPSINKDLILTVRDQVVEALRL